MDFGPNRTRINVQGDRLSSLPDDLIFKILAYHDTKYAVRTSALSSRWKSTRKSMPYLSFSSDDFTTLPKLSQFITHVLSHRNIQIDVSSLKLSFRGKVNQPFVKKVINYALSHNVQKMSVTCLEFPLSLFSSQSLKDLTLNRCISDQSVTPTSNPIIPTTTWELPALSTLHLDHVTFNTYNSKERGGIFAACKNLKSLTLTDCNITGSNGCFTIDHPPLSSLTLENGNWSSIVVNVVARHLENLIINYCNGDHLICAPGLTSLIYRSQHSLGFSANNLNSLEKADLYIGDPGKIDVIKVVDMFRKFHNVKFLTLGLEIVEVSNSSPECII
uniref:putative F-box/LRR-repeat protein At3g28410 n=1 Tax=Erigeron canadensis TaxID=72917 RepID=UPI001CB95A38|nr:putative F-box/LRR-repeat protein At3g28410 [Erigeron canadensis]